MFTYFITVIYHFTLPPLSSLHLHDSYDPDVANYDFFYFPHPLTPLPLLFFGRSRGFTVSWRYVVIRALVRLLVAWVRWSPHKWRTLPR